MILSLFVFFFIFLWITHQISFPFVSFTSKTLISLSLMMNIFLLYVFVSDVHQSLRGEQTTSLVNLWRLVYWFNFLFGFIILPILTQNERNFSKSSLISLLYQFYRKRLIIFVSIVVPLIFLIILIFNIPISSLVSKQTLLILPIFIVIIWGFLLLNLHLSLALNHIPQYLLRKLNSAKELGKI